MSGIQRFLVSIVAAAGLIGLAACNFQTLNLDKEKDEAAREVYRLFNEGDLAKLKPRFGPEMQNAEAEAALPQFAEIIPDAEPKSVRVAGWKTNWEAGKGERLETSHEYTYADRKVIASTVMSRAKKDAPWIIHGFHVKTEPLEMETTPGAAEKIKPAPGATEPLATESPSTGVAPPSGVAPAPSGDTAVSSGPSDGQSAQTGAGEQTHRSSSSSRDH